MKANNPYRKRQQVFADHKIQASLAWRLGGHWLLFTGTLLVLNTFLQLSVLFPQKSFGEALGWAAWSQIPLLACIAVLVPIFIRDALRISNRLAGPMVRLRRSLQSLANGEKVPPLVFRENDYWLESATEFNRVRQLLLGLYKDLDIPDGPQGSEQLAVAANLLHSGSEGKDSHENESTPLAEVSSAHPVNETSQKPASLSLANRVIWQGERSHKPSRYVNQETETPLPVVEAQPIADIPVTVSLR